LVFCCYTKLSYNDLLINCLSRIVNTQRVANLYCLMSKKANERCLSDETLDLDAEIERLLASLKKQNEILARELEERGITIKRNQKSKNDKTEGYEK